MHGKGLKTHLRTIFYIERFTLHPALATIKAMAHVIHYQDDIFLIASLARFVTDASRLEIDSEIMGDTVYSVIQMADRSLRTMRELVLSNDHLVDRTEYMRLLANTAITLSHAIQDLLNSENSLQQAFSIRSEELLAIAKAHGAMAEDFKTEIFSNISDNPPGDEQVSGDEISELLRG